MSTIGVDIGGTKILACRVENGSVVARDERPTPHTRDEFLSAVAQTVAAVRDDSVTGTGVGLPGYIHNEKLYHSPNLAFLEGQPVEKLLQDALGQEVVCENDANCFALAEHHLGAGKGCAHMIGIILGTGVGGGIILNGTLYTGAVGGAGEVGDIFCGDTSYEKLLCGAGLRTLYQGFGGSADAAPQDIWNDESATGVHTREAYLTSLGRFLASLINTLNPECIVLGGGLSNLPLYDDLPQYVEPHCSQAAFGACKIIQHAISDDAGVIGAAMLSQ